MGMRESMIEEHHEQRHRQRLAGLEGIAQTLA